MVYVYKSSAGPIQPWRVIRRAGPNNVAPDVRERYLILWNAEVVRRDGRWHYVFEFDARSSLEMNDPAAHTNGHGPPSYRDGVDWRAWLGDGWERIDADRRDEILRPDPDPRPGEVVITNLKLGNRPPRPE